MFKAEVGQFIRSYDFNESMHDRCADFIEGRVIDIQGETIIAEMTIRLYDGEDISDEFEGEDKIFRTAQNGAMMMDDSFGPRIFPAVYS